MKDNAGLKEVSYSITGGALVCQGWLCYATDAIAAYSSILGYWFPYAAAKAIAATFCYDIRWALTPVFGNEFPLMCRPPNDPLFGKFVIDPRIVQSCITETNRFREEGANYRVSATNAATRCHIPEIKFDVPRYTLRSNDTDSEYGSGNEHSDGSLFSPQVSPRSQYTWNFDTSSQTPYSQNTVGSPIVGSPESAIAQFQHISVSETEDYHQEVLSAKRTLSSVTMHNGYNEKTVSHPLTAMVDGCETEQKLRVDFADDSWARDDVAAAKALLLLSEADGKLIVSLPKRYLRR